MEKFYLTVQSGKRMLFKFLVLLFFPISFSASTININVEGPGGPILVLTSATNPFSSYTSEILLAEGFNEYATSDVSLISGEVLSNYDVIIVGEIPLNTTQVSLLGNWVEAGGTLIAFKPDSNLAPLLGIQKLSGTLADSYLLINTATGPGNGLVDETIQFHSEAGLYDLNGATSLATLYSSTTTSTSYPAVTTYSVGENGGVAVAFAYDLSRSVVYTRQGNPAWNGQERDGARPIRSNDLFYPDWVNLSKVEIPQADEQQRLLANIIVQNSNKPMPRFWYLPRGLKAAVVMTGDDHASGGTIARFNQYLQLSTDNSPEAVADWRAIRGSSYIYPNTPISEQQAKNFEDQGFEIALHLNTNCNNYTAQSIEGNLVTQLSQFNSFFPSLAEPETNRTHCIAFSDWASQPIAETNNGIRLDANYYYWPEFWVQDRPGLFTGSGFAMRFADLDGTIIDTYQLATQMTDESGQNYPFTIDRLLDNALGSKGYYGVFCANMHTDETYSPGSDAIIASASSRNVPVISAKQLLTWLDGRNGSFFENLVWDGSALSFNMGIGNGALNLEAMLPLVSGPKRLVGLNLDNVPVNYRTERIKGIDYAIFQAQSGNFIATYEINEPPIVFIDSPVNNATFLAFEDIEISAQASDPDGNVVKVEFFEGNTKIGEDIDSSNGWSFSWLQVEDGTYSITAKATDDKGSITFSEVVSITVEIDPSNFNCPCTVFENLVFPSSLLNEGAGIQLGMKFSSEIDGYINGVRFYKQNGHTGTHIGQLYDSSGNLLAEATFTNETNSGWQEVLFSNSVQITQNTTYIVSYHSSEGYYSVSDSYFVQAEENRPLKALANGENGPNGVYILSNTPAFPTDSFEASNYWVDAIFNTEPISLNIPPVVNITNPTQGANFTEPADIEITAVASDDDGQVVKVEFFNGTTKLGEDLDPLEDWSYSWNDVPSGNYTIRAVATDDQGRTAESSISISVTTIPVSQNSIVVENSLPGNPPSEWDIDGAGDLSIQGFATDISYNIGETARFKIDTDANNYSVKIYRLGYYQGNGARYQGDATITANLPQNQPNCISDSQTGLLDCGNWEESAIWDIPTNATSGIYIAKLTRGNGGSSHILFVVRDDSSNSDLFFQTSDATWQAYNIYGGRSLYTGSGGKATKVSYNRPFLTRDGGGGGGAEEDWIFNAEYPMLRWLERNGYDVTYTTNVDSDRRGELIKNHRVFLSVGHDEYWSGPHRNYVESARDQGTSLAFFSGNEVYWKTRWENSIDGNGNSHRTLVCYKEGTGGENTCGGKCDPTNDWTGLWRDGCNYVTGDPDLDGCRPENTLTGQISWEESDASITVPSTFKDLRFWRNTSVAELNEDQNASFTYATIGYEWNSEQDSYSSFYPDGRILMSRTVVDGAVHNISLYKHNSGAFVFGAGTVQWSWGLDSNHDRGDDAPSPDMQQATINLLADMGAQPASIQPGMTRATPSTDIEAPLLTYTSPAEETIVPVNTELLITGSTEEQNVIVAVEVSTDGGITWENAEGKQDWSYAWTPLVTGPASIQVRSYDDSGNLSVPEILNLTVSDELNNLVPEVEITGPLNNSQFISPAEIDITATASDSDGTITKVEFFSNNIKIGEDLISPYSFNWSNVGTGNYVLTARAIDNTGAFAISTEIAVSVILDSNNPNCPCTVFSNSDAPSSGIKNDGNAIQLGMKFRTTVDGIVTGVRFYKQNGDPGTHIGQLFDPSGTILAQTVFENETGSGWQQANFSNPVEVVAGNTYIISYHSSDGYYSSDDRGLENEISNGPVIGIANGENGPNGVYRYSPNPTFPNLSYQASNYWVDVVFETIGNPNSLPTVSISSPIENDSFIAPADILITADASDSDGTVTSVEFFQGTVSIGLDNDNSDGWSFSWLGALPGNYELTAIATDDLNGTTVSEIVNITVAEPLNTPPTVAITAPLNNEIFTSPADIIITAAATDADGTVTSVEFFEGSNSLGTDSDGSDGWSVNWSGVTGGGYALTAVATDDALETTTSEIINISVEDPNQLPNVAITSPLNNEIFTSPADIIITADATDADGSVTSVEFFEGSNSLGTDSDGSDGWSVNWNGVTAGGYALTAVATDDALETTTSEIINITVESPNVLPTVAITAPLNNEIFTSPADIIITADATDADGSVSSVEFFEGSNSLGTDSDGSDGWSVTWNGVIAGSYALTAVATDNDLETTTSEIINISVEDPNQLPTVAITSPLNNEIFTAPTDIIITADASDADGSITSIEFFEGSNSLGTDSDGSDGWSVNWNGVTAGSYALTAVATDNDLETTTSEIINITVESPNVLPTVAITSPLNNETFTSPAEIIITADATDADGSVTSVEFFEGSNSLGTDSDGSDGWSVTWNGVTAGGYALTAVATDDALETTTSEIINISVESPNVLPTVAITSPLNNETFTSPADIIITADATDPDGSVTSVEFFEASNSLGTDSDGSDGWSVSWNGVTEGSYALTAVATDDALETTTSEIINITVESPNVLPTVAITAPLNNDIFTAPAEIIITADASDSDGSVTSIEFFEGSNSLGTDSDGSDGWSVTWNGVTAGSYALTAVATDDALETTTSEIINVTVESPNVLPTVAITAPLNNETFTSPADIIITADATDADGSVTSVEFFEGSNSLGTDSDGSDGWSVTWNGVTAGGYALTAVATDDALETTTSEIINISVESPNVLPTVAITSPLNNETFTSPADIIITADATDPDGSITSVEFFEGSNSLGTDSDGSDGWSVSWNGVTAGSYALTAVATDDDLENTTSEIINISVESPNVLPTLAITSPVNNEIFTAPADIIITADATDTDGIVTSVEFFEGSNSLGTDSDGSDGWSVSWNGVTEGSYALTAVATDDALETTTSEITNITVESPNVLPTVAITSPLNNETFTSPADIIITADATDPDGSVISVEFFEGTNSLGIDSNDSDGWSLSWNGVTAGSYALTAVATDDDLETTTSEIINITVESPNVLPTVAITSPLNNETFTSPAEIIITADATDADGSVTSVEFFEGSNSLGTDSDSSDGWSVTWNGVTAGSYALTAVATDNDAGSGTSNVITINVQLLLPSITNFIPSSGPVGSIVLLNGLNLGGVTEVSFGPSVAEIISVSNTQMEVRVPPQNGKLPKSVKISVVSPSGQFTSTDKFTVTEGTVPANNSPVVSFITPATNTGFVAPATVDMLVNASDSDGFVTKVEFFNGNTKLGEDLTSPYELSWTNVPTGSYSLRAVATDDKGATGSSGTVNILVSEPGGNESPVVSITSPSNNSSFTALANINITANASDPDGSIAQVEFFNGSTSLGIDSTSPYSISWNNVTAGTYLLTAIATDNLGLVTTSNVITINVTPSQNLNAPSSLSALWISNSEVYLLWKDNDLTEDGFILERSTKPDFSGRIDYISLPANTISYTDRNLNNKKGGGILFYRIKAVKGNLSSVYSNTAQAAPLSGALNASSQETQESAINEEFVVYPNPTSGGATVKFILDRNRDYTLNLFNSMGTYLMLIAEGKATAGLEYTFDLSVNQYPDGLYFVILKTKDSSQSFSLIIKR